MGEVLMTALLQSLDKLADIERNYSVIVRDAVGKEIAYRDATQELEECETFHRSEIITLGLEGGNETARQANLRVRLQSNPYVRDARAVASQAQAERDRVAAEVRVWDVRQKASRAEVAALTALVRAEAAEQEFRP